MDTQNYKRTLAGSVGAGMGALLGASGKTYFVIEHKTTSKYHQAGESQKIIVDQVELGRAATCQIRFDESFETVSRRHAAIMKEGDNWKLVHLSQANPTLVNGMPINGSYYLQNGDEIQLSVGGPRMGFIIPQGRQALTSSIGLTERMNLFRQQALRPYKKALYTMGVVFVVVIALLGAWNYKLGEDNKLQAEKLEQQKLELLDQQIELDKTKNKMAEIDGQRDSLIKVINSNAITNEQELAALNAELKRVTKEYNSVISNYNAMQSEVEKLTEAVATNEIISNPSNESISNGNAAAENSSDDYATETTASATAVSSNASANLSDYYDYIYTIKIDRIDIEYNGRKFDLGIPTSKIIGGTGFFLEDGTFITDRQNIEPWIYSNDETKEEWKETLAQCNAAGANIVIHFLAYSTKGTGAPLRFTNEEFVTPNANEWIIQATKITEDFLEEFEEKYGIKLSLEEDKNLDVKYLAPTEYSWAYIRNKGTYGSGIPYNTAVANDLPGGSDIHMVGYADFSDIHALRPAHFNDKTNVADTKNNTIILQNRVSELGYYGSPAFIKSANGKYEVIGLMVGSIKGKDRLIPISNIKD